MSSSITKIVSVSVASYGALGPRRFDYVVPKGMSLQQGDVVIVPFGKQRSLGVVYSIAGQAQQKNITYKTVQEKIPLPNSLPKYFLDLAEWMQVYYASSSRAVWQTMLPTGIKAKSKLKPVAKTNKKLLPLNQLSVTQKKAYKSLQSHRLNLLYGVTGSGKTEIYMQSIYDMSALGKSSIVLVPEIMLTTQLEQRLSGAFDNVLVLHSGLSPARRKYLWLQALELSANQPVVVLGTRSALFTPLHNLGLIIVDEEHEPSYKQESGPRYEAQMVAAQLAQITKSRLILGSATPSLRSYFLTHANKLHLVKLGGRHNSQLPILEMVDMKREADSLLSKRLETEITDAIKHRKQVLLFLNRRGSASALLCQNCASAVRCPHCNVSMHFHADVSRLICHYCGYKTPPPTQCQNCRSSDLRFIGDGTKKLETLIAARWPDARLARIDRDNAKIDHLQKTYRDFAKGEIDILVGTQMISRGIDIENLHVVGIIDADSALQMPDFASSERAFSLIVQASGRAGRRTQKGIVIIQTKNKDNATLKAAAQGDYESFYNQELALREKFAYPPLCYLVKLSYAHKTSSAAKAQADKLKISLGTSRGLRIIGPVLSTKRNLMRQSVSSILIKSSSRKALLDVVSSLPTGWQADLDPITIL